VVAQALRWLLQPNSPFAIDLPPTMSMLRWLAQFFRASHSPLLARRAALLAGLSLESVQLFQNWSTSLGFQPRCSGTLEVFRTPQSVSKFRQQLPAMQAAGIEVELLDSASTRAFAPHLLQQISGGAYYPNDCVVDPLPFVNAVRAQLRVEWPEMPIMFAEAKLLATPLEGRLRLGGYLHLAKPERGIPRHVTAKMLTESLLAYVPTAMVEELRRTCSPVWAGFRPCSSDGLPIIGRTAKYDNLYFATGHGDARSHTGSRDGKAHRRPDRGKRLPG
jgi:glycine/D-amino acid oxidase-like deaminating enzyme